MSIESLTSADNAKLRYVIEEGLKVTQQVKDLRESLRDTVKAVAEEFDIEPKVINKTIRAAFKSSIDADKEVVEAVESLLTLVGRR
jgi:transposase-like protein